jgi:hypothetical protein
MKTKHRYYHKGEDNIKIVGVQVLTTFTITLPCYNGRVVRRHPDVSGVHLHGGKKVKQETSMQHIGACCILRVGLLLGLPFSPEDRANIFLRNISSLKVDYVALHPT